MAAPMPDFDKSMPGEYGTDFFSGKDGKFRQEWQPLCSWGHRGHTLYYKFRPAEPIWRGRRG